MTLALQNRDLLKSIGEYEEHQPVEARPIREMRAIFDCLGGDGHQLGRKTKKKEHPGLAEMFSTQANKVTRTVKVVGSGGFTDKVRKPLQTGFAQLDSYGEARKSVAHKSIDDYYKKIRSERKRNTARNQSFEDDDDAGSVEVADAAARDAVRCLEHAMVIVAGEKVRIRSGNPIYRQLKLTCFNFRMFTEPLWPHL